MELLIIKSGKDYIRIKDNEYLPVTLDKASVFEYRCLSEVRHHEARVIVKGFEAVSIKKLILTEEDL